LYFLKETYGKDKLFGVFHFLRGKIPTEVDFSLVDRFRWTNLFKRFECKWFSCMA